MPKPNKKDTKPVEAPQNVPIDPNFERMLKQFIRYVDKTGALQEVRARRYYIKPSEIKRLAKKQRRNR